MVEKSRTQGPASAAASGGAGAMGFADVTFPRECPKSTPSDSTDSTDATFPREFPMSTPDSADSTAATFPLEFPTSTQSDTTDILFLELDLTDAPTADAVAAD